MKQLIIRCFWPIFIAMNLAIAVPKHAMAGAFGFGGEEPLLSSILMETITLVQNNLEQLNQLQQMFSKAEANLELMYKVHDGLDRAIAEYNTFSEFTDFSEFKEIRDIGAARSFVQTKYGYIQDKQRDLNQKRTQDVLSEETASQAQTSKYSSQVNRETKRLNVDIDRADSLPKIQKVHAKATVANIQTSAGILNAQNKTNRLLAEDLGQKNRESERERLKAINTEKQFVGALAHYRLQRGKVPLY